MKVLVTGGTGFIGSQLVAALVRRGEQVRVLRRENSSLVVLEGLPVEHVIGDILEPEALAQAVAGCDLVFHVAAISSYWRARRADIYRVNVEGTRAVMAACLAAGVPRVVHTSSQAAIGIPAPGTLADEQTPFDALSQSFVYADSKHRAEAVVQEYVSQGLSAVIVNPGVVIGPGDHHLISGSMVVEFARGRVFAVPPGGMCVADVEAVVQGHIAAAERGRVGERYILGGENLKFHQAVELLAEVIGRPASRVVLPRQVLGPAASLADAFNWISHRPPLVIGEQIRLSRFEFFMDSSKAVRELGYAILPFRGAAEKAYAWYRDHGYL